MLRRLSRGHARQAPYSMQAWIKRIALGVLLAALFVIQFVPSETSPGEESSGEESSGEENSGEENSGEKSPGKNGHVNNNPIKDRLSRDGSLPVNTLDGDSPTPP